MEDLGFQFHIGSIKGWRQKMRQVWPNFAFQFHIGSIKGPQAGYDPAWQNGFNSTLVRLKGIVYDHWADQNGMFQFHIGSIKGSTQSWASATLSK